MVNHTKTKRWVTQHKILIFRVLIIVVFFLLALIKGIPLEGIQPTQLKIDAYPPGYPVEGQTWTIEVWASQENRLTWKPVPNATVAMHTSLQGEFMKTTDDDGKAAFTYTSTLGSVDFEANFDNLSTAWTPQEKFVSNDIAFLVVGIFGIGSTSLFWQTAAIHFKHEKHDRIGQTLSGILVILTTVGFFLCFFWLHTWRLGTEWGFGNQIMSLNGFSITFDRHLFGIMIGAVITASLIWTKEIISRWKSRKKIPDYIK